MKRTHYPIPVFLTLCLLAGSVYAQPGTGNTIINATVTGVWKLISFPQYSEIMVPENYSFYENLTVFQSDTKNISVYLNRTDTNGFLKFVNGAYLQDNYTIYNLPIYLYRNVTLRIFVQPGMGFDNATYNITVHSYSKNDSRYNSTALKIRVNNTSPVDKAEVLNIYPTSLYSGESLTASISVHKIFPSEAAGIQACYCIEANPNYQCGPGLNDYGCDWKTFKEWLNYTKTVTVSESPGSYYFIAAVKYPGDVNIARAISSRLLVKAPQVPPGTGPPAGAPAPAPALKIKSPDYLEAAPGERISFDAEIKNTGSANAPGTILDLYGVPENWISIAPPGQDIPAGDSKNYSVLIYLPFTANEQIYSLSLVAKSGKTEATKTITLTVAMTMEKRAKFLLDEARSKKEEAEGIIEKMKLWGIDATEPENVLASANTLLEDVQRMFESGDYSRAAGRAKEAIDAYKSVIASANSILEREYLLLLDRIILRLKGIENLTEEKEIIESIRDKIDEGNILLVEDRFTEAYQAMMEAYQLLDQLLGKAFFREMTQNVVIISILIVIIVAISMVLFYKKKMSGFLKNIRIEEHKKSLKQLFGKKIEPGMAQREKPKIDREKLGEIHSLLKIGESISDSDVEKAKEAYVKAREIYNSLSADEKRLILDDTVRLTRLYNKLVRESR